MAAVLASVSFAPSASVGVGQSTQHVVTSLPAIQKQVPPEPTSKAYLSALARLGERVEAVEAATVTLVGTPIAPSRAGGARRSRACRSTRRGGRRRAGRQPGRPDRPSSSAPGAGRPPGGRRRRPLVCRAQWSRASRPTSLLVAIDLADQSAQNAALARLLVATDPHVSSPRRGGRRRPTRPRTTGTSSRRPTCRDPGPGRGRGHHARRPAGRTSRGRGPEGGDPAGRAAGALDRRLHQREHPARGALPGRVRPEHHLRCDAAEALARMNAAYRQAFGHDMVLTGSYRSLADQVRTKAAKGGLAAVARHVEPRLGPGDRPRRRRRQLRARRSTSGSRSTPRCSAGTTPPTWTRTAAARTSRGTGSSARRTTAAPARRHRSW